MWFSAEMTSFKAILCLSLLVLASVLPALAHDDHDDEDSSHHESEGERGTLRCGSASFSGLMRAR
jgi:hypothetical protein